MTWCYWNSSSFFLFFLLFILFFSVFFCYSWICIRLKNTKTFQEAATFRLLFHVKFQDHTISPPSHLIYAALTHCIKNLKLHVQCRRMMKKKKKKSIFPTLSLWHKCVEGVGLIEKLLIIRTMGSIELQKSCIRIHFPVWIVNNTKKKVWISVN